MLQGASQCSDVIWTGHAAQTIIDLAGYKHTGEYNLSLLTKFLSFCRFLITQVGREYVIRSTQPHLHVTVSD